MARNAPSAVRADREAYWRRRPCLEACGMSKSRDCGHRQGRSPGLPEGRGEVFTVGSVGPLVAGACGPYHWLKPGGQKSGSRAVATGGPGGDPYPAVPQFGFITTFGAACLLAPLSNWVEIRLDARQFIRPVAERAQDKGILFHMLEPSRTWRASAT